VDETAAATLARNFGVLQPGDAPLVFSGDDGNLEEIDLRRVVRQDTHIDVLIGGPPCQGFSRIGRAKLDSLSDEGFEGDPRNVLYRRFLDAAEIWRPLAVVMENVPGMLSVAGRNVADDAAADLAARGYRVGYAILNAAWYGVPQFRERLFIIGFRDDLGKDPEMPQATHQAVLPSGYARRNEQAWNLALPFIRHRELPVATETATHSATTVLEAFDGLPALRHHLGERSRKTPRYQRTLGGAYSRLMRNWPGLAAPTHVMGHIIRRTPRDYEIFRRMRPGDRYPEALAIARERFAERLTELAEGAPSPGSAEYRELEKAFVPPYPEDMFRDKWRKLIPEQPSWTVPAHLSRDGYSHIHYDGTQARSISVREAARLQSFPDGYLFEGAMGDAFRQIGNAVPPLLAWAIAGSVCASLGVRALAPRLS
jgi:DNA (cytosine-5)-methyltransferase 1